MIQMSTMKLKIYEKNSIPDMWTTCLFHVNVV